MGTEVQSKMYMPGYYSLRDLNDNAGNGSWSLHQQKKIFGQYREFFLTRPAIDVNEGNDKEQLRQTILKHECVFKHQLHELHRVYKIQRDMMNEVRSKELQKHMIQAGALQSSMYSSGCPLVNGKARNHVFNLHSVDLSHGSLSMSGADRIHCAFNSMKENTMQSSYSTSQNGIALKDYGTLESGSKRLRRRLFDLELPPDTYFNDEEEGLGVSGVSKVGNYPRSRNHEITHDTDGNLSMRTGANPGCYSDSPSPNLYMKKANGLNDLNQPIKIEEASASIDTLGNIFCSKEEMERRVLSLNSHSGFQCSAKGRDGGVSRNIMNLETERRQKGWLAYNAEAGQTGSNGSSLCAGFSPEKDLPKTFNSRQVEPRNSHELATSLLSHKIKTESHVKKKIFGVEICERTPDASVEASCTLLQHSFIPQSNTANSESSSISHKKLCSGLSKNISVHGNPSSSSFPQSNKSSVTLMHSPQVIQEKLLVNSNSRYGPSIKAEGSNQNDLCLSSQLESKESWVCYSSNAFGHRNGISDSSSASEQIAQYAPKNNFKDVGSMMDAKFAEEKASALAPKRYQTEAISDSVNGTRKQHPQGGLPWLKVVPSRNGHSSEERQGSSQMNLNSLHNYSQHLVDKTEMIRKSSFQSSVQDSLSATCALDAEQWRTEVGECSSNRKILGFSISEKSLMSKDLPSPSTPSKPSCCTTAVDGADSVKVGLLDTKDQDAVSPKLGEQLKVEGLTGKGFINHHGVSRNHIDLNLCFVEEGFEEKAQSSHSSSKTNLKVAFEIDLEAPVVIEEMDITPGAESLDGQPEEPVHMLQDESRKLREELIKVAAEALVAISSSSVHLQVDADFHQSETSPSESLHWFAEIVSSYKGDVENESGSVSMNHDSVRPGDSFHDHGMDYFEFMTLNLTETKVEEYRYEPQVLDSPSNENTLTRRPRRGQARRGRQRKDFQRDVLPTVASLSKNEVTDDLQTIEGLIRATGGTWQSSLALKKGGRGGGGKGRRRSEGSDSPANVTATYPPPQVQPPKCREAALEETSLIGWGKRTRRPPRQRCSINNPPLTIK
ncbi:hypothetical protein ACOSQ2_028314 [Xanthoceras sorbifolium]|uniref:Uncharacterized protein n=1 Tax=Xanthoceras sorbifolium TaxID=99658 RepID=A0ABQ8HDE5_9ROSI|nr:hypothetical protein JRO89_XS12G0231400 [Xanthoceras sorbifolium]